MCKFMPISEIDNAPDEKKKGYSINYTTIDYHTEKREYCHIDCPGHADHVKNMIIGISGVDVAILVISAEEGIMQQTKEHIILCKHMGVNSILVYINKEDLISDKEILQLIELEVRDLLTKYGYDGQSTIFIKGSALCALEGGDPKKGEGSIKELLDTLDTKIKIPERQIDQPFYLPVSHTINLGVIFFNLHLVGKRISSKRNN